MSGSIQEADLARRAKRLGLYMVTHKPPNGRWIRFKFSAANADYHDLPDGFVLGAREADAYLDGYAAACELVAAQEEAALAAKNGGAA